MDYRRSSNIDLNRKLVVKIESCLKRFKMIGIMINY